MFTKIEPLNYEKHHDLRFNQVTSLSHTRSILHAPVSAAEFFQASKYYAIVFPIDNTTPKVLFTLTTQTNQYLQEDGIWAVPYIPAHLRGYPFVLVKTANKNENNEQVRFVFCIDRSAPHFSAPQGDILFTANGEITDFCKKSLNFLETFQADLNKTRILFQELEDRELLVPRQVEINRNNTIVPVDAYRVINLEKINSLNDDILARWVRSGLMHLIYLHNQSLANLHLFTNTR